MPNRKSWMTKTGGVLVALGGILTGSAGVVPVKEWESWMQFAGYVIGSLGVAMVGNGIRRKMPDRIGG